MSEGVVETKACDILRLQTISEGLGFRVARNSTAYLWRVLRPNRKCFRPKFPRWVIHVSILCRIKTVAILI